MRKKLLVVRFSAMGDLAMTIPVLYSLAEQYPNVDIFVLSRGGFEKLFVARPQNIYFIGVDLNDKAYKGLLGGWNLFNKIKTYNFDFVADLHSVLRSRLLGSLFLLHGTPVTFFRKGRLERWALTRRWKKKKRPLTSMFERYRSVLLRLGFDFEIRGKVYAEVPSSTVFPITSKKRIGVAPFAMHKAKNYPLPQMEILIEKLCTNVNFEVFLFGGGQKEKATAEEWQKYHNLTSIVGKYTFTEELSLIKSMDIMLTMDSANMHIASLVGTRVISIWGGTHPNTGYVGFGQHSEDCITLNMDCSPCSIFGKKECYRKDHACLTLLSPDVIYKRICEAVG